MDNGSKDEKIKLEPNAKPYLLKRIISDGFDTVVIFLLFMILSAALFASPLAGIYNTHYAKYKAVQDSVKAEYGDDSEAIGNALRDNAYYRDELFAANLHGFLLKMLAGFLSEAAVLLAFPLISSARATPGKMLTKIMPFSEKRRTKALRRAIICRFLFIFIIDSTFLYLYAGIFTFLLVPVVRLTEMLLNKKNKTICDAVTGIRIIERLSYDGIETI